MGLVIVSVKPNREGKVDAELTVQQHDFKRLVIANITGIETFYKEKVYQKQFHDDWEKFNDYGSDKAYKIVEAEWQPHLDKLDRLRETGMGIFLIAHSKVANFKNPRRRRRAWPSAGWAWSSSPSCLSISPGNCSAW